MCSELSESLLQGLKASQGPRWILDEGLSQVGREGGRKESRKCVCECGVVVVALDQSRL